MSNYLIFVRHGETDWNAEKRFQGGNSDVPLNAKGRFQAALIANVFLRERIVRLFSSPLKRALDTAEAIRARLGLSAEVLEELRELSFGDYEGVLEEELAARCGEEFRLWRQSHYTLAPPGGESIADAGPRAEAALARVTPSLQAGNIILCAHQAIVIALKAALTDDYSVETARRYRQGNTEISYWEVSPGTAREARRIQVSGSLAGMIRTAH